MNAVTTGARIRIVWPLNKSLHRATGVVLEQYEEHVCLVRLDTPTVDGVEYSAIPEESLALLGDDWPAIDERAVAMRGDWHVDLPDEQLNALLPTSQGVGR